MEKAPDKRWSMPGCRGRFFVRGKKNIIWYKYGRNFVVSTELTYSRLNRKLAADKIILLENPELNPNNSPATVNDAFREFMTVSANNKAKRTLQAYLYAYKFVFTQNCRMRTNDIQNFLDAAINRDRAKKTIKTHIDRIKSFFNYCVRKGWLDENPVNENYHVKVVPKIIEIFFPEELENIFSYWRDRDKIFYLYLQILYKCALRRDEAKRMEWSQVISNNKYRDNIIFKSSKYGNKPDYFPLSDAIIEILDQIPGERVGKIFYYNDERNLSRRFTRSMKALGIPKTHNFQSKAYGRNLHTLRKTRITEWLFEHNLSPQVVAALSRDNIETIMKYYAYKNVSDLRQFVV